MQFFVQISNYLFLNIYRYLYYCRVMTEAMRDHKDVEVRTAAYELLTHCCQILR